MKKYDLIILSGGKGTRVKKYTKYIPKCLIKIKGKPFLYYQLRYLKKHKIRNVIISTCYLSYKIKEYVRNNINFLNIKIIDDIKPLGTGGAINNSLKYLKKNFFVLYGDSYLNFNLNNMANKTNFAIMAVYKNNNKFDRSNVKIKNKNIIYNKSSQIKNDLNYIDYGVSYVNKKVFKNIQKKKFDLSKVMQNLSKEKKLKGYIVKKRFYEIGSYNGIKEFRKFIAK